MAIENPLEPVLEIFDFEIGAQNFLPLYEKGDKTEDHLSVFPEYIEINWDREVPETVLQFNCAIQREGENHAFLQFTDEVEFYKFMGAYNSSKNYKD